MAETASEAPARPAGRPNALAEIQFASVIDPDLTPSEDETPDEKVLQLETVQSAIGVSIGQQQTRLTSPNTPAAEKAAALDETDGAALFQGWQSQPGTLEQSAKTPAPVDSQSDESDFQEVEKQKEETREREQIDAPGTGDTVLSQENDIARLPSPWRAGPRKLTVDDRDYRSALRDSWTYGVRRRAMSGGSTTDTLKRYMPSFSLPKSSSLLNFSLPSFSVTSFDSARSRLNEGTGQRTQVNSVYEPSRFSALADLEGRRAFEENDISRFDGSGTSRPQYPSTAPLPQREFDSATTMTSATDTPPPRQGIERRSTPRLRRSNSEGSLVVYRARSIVSLGDDSRFENVSEQVNSRLKAIKDSWQDSNFKLPSLPAMSNFSFGSREDFFRSARTPSPRGLNIDSLNTNSRASFLVNSTSSSRGGSLKSKPKTSSSTDLAGMPASISATHPQFTKAARDLTGDLVVLGGYRGSILRSADPPHRQLWAPIKAGLNLRKVDLELGLYPEDEETEENRVIPAGMLTHIGPVDIAKRLFKRLRASENVKNGDLRVHNYGYDWRLSPYILSRRMIEYLETLPCNQPGVPPEKRGAVVLAHSLGGLITRHVINHRPELIAGVVYAGVPQTCVNILGPLRNGDDVLLSSRILTAQVNFTIRTSFALLPLDGKCFINKKTKEEYRVDFFDIESWKEYRLSPCIAPAIPAPGTSAPTLLSASGLLNAMSSALPSLPGRKSSMSRGSTTNGANGMLQSNSYGSKSMLSPTTQKEKESQPSPIRDAFRDTARNATEMVLEGGAQSAGITPQMTNNNQRPNLEPTYPQSNPAIACTIPHDEAVAYLTRTLAEIKKFKQELAYRDEIGDSNRYPPIALIYGKSTPTVYGAKVESREAIKRSDVYEELAFASGDGVVLAKAAMVPEGYSVVRGGVVASDRGHVTLLGDLEAVGKCLNAVIQARKKGVGMGESKRDEVRKGKQKVENAEEGVMQAE